MSFNAKKCQVIRITPKNRPPLPATYILHAGLGLALMLLPLVWLSAVYFVGMIESSSLSWRWLRNILIYVEGVGVALWQKQDPHQCSTWIPQKMIMRVPTHSNHPWNSIKIGKRLTSRYHLGVMILNPQLSVVCDWKHLRVMILNPQPSVVCDWKHLRVMRLNPQPSVVCDWKHVRSATYHWRLRI
jgi:hypothetical protein